VPGRVLGFRHQHSLGGSGFVSCARGVWFCGVAEGPRVVPLTQLCETLEDSVRNIIEARGLDAGGCLSFLEVDEWFMRQNKARVLVLGMVGVQVCCWCCVSKSDAPGAHMLMLCETLEDSVRNLIEARGLDAGGWGCRGCIGLGSVLWACRSARSLCAGGWGVVHSHMWLTVVGGVFWGWVGAGAERTAATQMCETLEDSVRNLIEARGLDAGGWGCRACTGFEPVVGGGG
jgi:hypothetical protein